MGPFEKDLMDVLKAQSPLPEKEPWESAWLPVS
jgi:hypothetical protein